ncbi:hypothetical protein [Streptomyces sp. NPDC096152]|uniref:hypothetical protein n=1 Tax=Streptomyces sp. NPDC096152 TaxID=3366078 RepID=UPI003808D298
MGSLRNPVGPLPSSIYWRRRVVLLSVLALLALVAVWIVASGGGGSNDNGGGSNGKHPAPSTITPGPSGSGPAISQHPGGRDESGGSGSGSDGSGSGSGSGAGGTGDSGGAGGGGSVSGGSAGGSDDGAKGGGGAGGVLPAGSTLADCTTGAVKLTLRSVHNSYGPGAKPTFELTAKNSSGSDCKVDLGPKSTVVTVSRSDSSDDYWSSDHCPRTAGSALYRVPAGSGITYTVQWDRKPSAPRCATPPPGSAGAGTYLVEAKVPGFPKLQTSFVLSAD